MSWLVICRQKNCKLKKTHTNTAPKVNVHVMYYHYYDYRNIQRLQFLAHWIDPRGICVALRARHVRPLCIWYVPHWQQQQQGFKRRTPGFDSLQKKEQPLSDRKVKISCQSDRKMSVMKFRISQFSWNISLIVDKNMQINESMMSLPPNFSLILFPEMTKTYIAYFRYEK